MTDKEKQLSDLACFVHASLATLHVLGVIYNLKRKNWKNVCVHSFVFTYDVLSYRTHCREKLNG